MGTPFDGLDDAQLRALPSVLPSVAILEDPFHLRLKELARASGSSSRASFALEASSEDEVSDSSDLGPIQEEEEEEEEKEKEEEEEEEEEEEGGGGGFDVDEVLANAAAPEGQAIKVKLRTFDSDSDSDEEQQKKPRRQQAAAASSSPFAAPPPAANRRRQAPAPDAASPFDAAAADTTTTTSSPFDTSFFDTAPVAFPSTTAFPSFPAFEQTTPAPSPAPAPDAKVSPGPPVDHSEATAEPASSEEEEAAPLEFSEDRLSREQIKAQLNIRKGGVLPIYPAEEAALDASDAHYDRKWRLSEIMAQSIVLLDVKRVRLLLQSGLNPDGRVELSHSDCPRMVELINSVWASAKKAAAAGEPFLVSHHHPLRESQRKASLGEIEAIAKLVLLRGPKLSSSVTKHITQEDFRKLVETFPRKEDMPETPEKAPTPSEEQTFFQTKLKRARAAAERSALRETPQGEKEFKKKLKKLPKAIVKKYTPLRVTPAFNAELRTMEQLYLACYFGDALAVHIYLNQDGSDVEGPVECWDEESKRDFMTPLEVLAVHAPTGGKPEERERMVNFVTYKRTTDITHFVDCAHALVAAGAKVTDFAKEAAAGKQLLLDAFSPPAKGTLRGGKGKDKTKEKKGGLFKKKK